MRAEKQMLSSLPLFATYLLLFCSSHFAIFSVSFLSHSFSFIPRWTGSHPSLTFLLFLTSFAPAVPCLLVAHAARCLLSFLFCLIWASPAFSLTLFLLRAVPATVNCFVMPAFFSVTKQNQFIHPPLFPSFTLSIPNLPCCCFFSFFFFALSI